MNSPLELEAEDLTAHVAACHQRHKALVNGLDLLNRRAERIEGWLIRIAWTLIVGGAGGITGLLGIIWRLST